MGDPKTWSKPRFKILEIDIEGIFDAVEVAYRHHNPIEAIDEATEVGNNIIQSAAECPPAHHAQQQSLWFVVLSPARVSL